VKKDYTDRATSTMLLGGLFGTSWLIVLDSKIIGILFLLLGIVALWQGYRLRAQRKNKRRPGDSEDRSDTDNDNT
jgi:membrane protein implicated in regulation of membrane protease activity